MEIELGASIVPIPSPEECLLLLKKLGVGIADIAAMGDKGFVIPVGRRVGEDMGDRALKFYAKGSGSVRVETGYLNCPCCEIYGSIEPLIARKSGHIAFMCDECDMLYGSAVDLNQDKVAEFSDLFERKKPKAYWDFKFPFDMFTNPKLLRE